MNNKPLVILSVLLGIVFLALAFVYFTTPAGSLPSYMPGFQAQSATIHIKHGIGTLLLGVLLFIFAWFKSAKPKSA